MPAVAAKLITAEEFMHMPDPKDGSKQELVRGEIITMPPPFFNHGEVQGTIATLIKQFVKLHKLGRITTESGVITARNPDSVRGPDIAYWSKKRLPLTTKVEGYPEIAADLCVEVLSESKRRRALKKKLQEYFKSGVRMVWVVDTETRTATVYRSALQGQLLSEEAEITGEEVLPGFRCKVAEFFEV